MVRYSFIPAWIVTVHMFWERSPQYIRADRKAMHYRGDYMAANRHPRKHWYFARRPYPQNMREHGGRFSFRIQEQSYRR